jgi:hypothetical protein
MFQSWLWHEGHWSGRNPPVKLAGYYRWSLRDGEQLKRRSEKGRSQCASGLGLNSET